MDSKFAAGCTVSHHPRDIEKKRGRIQKVETLPTALLADMYMAQQQ